MSGGMGEADFWLWCPGSFSLLFSGLKVQTPEKNFLEGVLLNCSVGASSTRHTLPPLCSHSSPGFSGPCLGSILLSCSQEWR